MRAQGSVEADGAPPVAPLLELRGLSKSFGATAALRGAELTLHRGEVHALLGQNGSGKSTLIKVLTGFHEPDAGLTVRVRGEEAHLTRTGPVPDDGGSALQVRTVHQHLGLVAGLSVLDNVALVLGYRTGFGGRVDWRAQEAVTRELLATVGAGDLDVHAAVEACTPLQRAQIAIARAMHGWEDGEGLLILDEPTATLPAEHVDHLLASIRELRARGVAVLYVSHRLPEVVAIADRVTVLRDGQVVAAQPATGLGHDDLVELMLGSDGAAAVASGARKAHELADEEHGRPTLAATGLRGRRLRGVDFAVRRGEILGFAGLVGSGQEELPYLLTGAQVATGGVLHVGDDRHDAARMTPRQAVQLGIALVPADRAGEALLPQQDIAENISLPQLRVFQRLGMLRRDRERRHAERWIRDLEVVAPDTAAPVSTLSGGNQQKIVLARLLGITRAALVLAEPTAGVDIGAKTLIYEQLRAQAAAGLPIIVCSTDVLDLASVCTRVLVLADGEVVDELVGDEIDEDALMRAILSERVERG
ncbi:sugar ABC transporter ATP-binding protein [Nitriliruptoraceae bacterium ZYF776]|nr:sugar ABC transporter ATP-binding protein [Profundirhabdus halotolerans]